MKVVAYLPEQHRADCPAWDDCPCNCGAQPVPLVRLDETNAAIAQPAKPSHAREMSKHPVALSRDDTEHGVYYYKASEVDAIIAAIAQPEQHTELPPMPEAWEHFQLNRGWKSWENVIPSAAGEPGVLAAFTADQMQAYARAAIAQPEQTAGDWISEKGVRLLMRTEYDRGYRQCKYDSMDAIAQPTIKESLTVQTIAQPEQTAPPESALQSLARRCLWIAYCWNDHNFSEAYTYARKTAQELGINDFDDANKWLEAQPVTTESKP